MLLCSEHFKISGQGYKQWEKGISINTERGRQICDAQASLVEDREFETRPSQTSDLQNLTLVTT